MQMELQLGLAPPSSSVNEFDLNCQVFEPNEDDHDGDLVGNLSFNKNDDSMGWPPIKKSRSKALRNYNQQQAPKPKSVYVKVQMEGVGIARKIDLGLHHSYQSLTETLLNMFETGQVNVSNYSLTYQDGDGDWLLAGDTPWHIFAESARRLRLMRSCGHVKVA